MNRRRATRKSMRRSRRTAIAVRRRTGAASAPLRLRSGRFPVSAIPQLIRLFEQTFWAKGRSPSDIRTMLRHTPITFSVWRGRTLIGFARLLTDFTYRAVLYDVVVDQSWQGRGVGRNMMEAMHAHPRLKRCTSWYLATRDQHEFYEKFGWMREQAKFMLFRSDRETPWPAERQMKAGRKP
jgi:GNAT superfamily N-acetyltransferase